jgi:hypothetical protein
MPASFIQHLDKGQRYIVAHLVSGHFQRNERDIAVEKLDHVQEARSHLLRDDYCCVLVLRIPLSFFSVSASRRSRSKRPALGCMPYFPHPSIWLPGETLMWVSLHVMGAVK